jgi:hypothetical protein
MEPIIMPRRALSSVSAREPVRQGLDLTGVRALPVKDFARAYGLTDRTVWRAIESGRLKSIAIGRKRLVLLEGIEKIVDPGTRSQHVEGMLQAYKAKSSS